MKKLYGGIEAGGTKFICIIASDPENIFAETRIPTTTPAETIEQVINFFAPHLHQLHGIGLGVFGPADVDLASPTYGYITTTPKQNWGNINILGMLRQKINLPIKMEMDVAVAGLGEAKWGASKGLSHSLYLTIGTGIGGGYIVNGEPLRGLVSLEMGHIRIPRNAEDLFQGACPFHADCFEGLASGVAIQARFNQPAETLSADHPFWDVEVNYIAHALANYVFTLAPQKIILGGGIMQNDFLFPKIRTRTQALINKYLSHPALLDLKTMIVPPALGSRSGALGAIALMMN